jgi:arylsulfatase A-like enzyme
MSDSDSRQLNVIFILTDDQGPWAAGCCGNDEVRTPNIDRLAETGVRFENFFCTSPVCSPARASLMTGRIPSAHGVHDWIRDGNMPPNSARYLEGLTCYTDVLGANGYTVGLSGKWHLGDSMTPQHGFNHWFAMPLGGSKYNDAEMIRDGVVEVQPGYVTDVITDDALQFIEANKSQPFYLSVHYNAPHTPFDGHPQDIVDSYDDCPFKTCPQEAAHPWAIPGARIHLGNRESLKGYFAAITAMDLNVGRILEKLEGLGLRENTLVVFSSDNGYSCGHHGFWHKGNGTFPLNMYENSVKVPFIMSHPGGLPQGRVTTAMASQYDFMPTLLDYLGLETPADPLRPGRSFQPALLGETDDAQDEVVIFDEYGPVRMIRTQEWKYVHRYPYGPHELYDLVNDPDERKNLVDEKSKGALVTEMRQQLASWFSRYVLPELDGTRFQVTGLGHAAKIEPGSCGENAFHPLPEDWHEARQRQFQRR